MAQAVKGSIILAAVFLLGAGPPSRERVMSRQRANNLSTIKVTPKRSATVVDKCEGTSTPQFSCDAISAQASLDQAHYAGEQVVTAIAQAIFGGLTMLAAGTAAFYAWKAAGQARIGNQLTKDASRAWISIEQFSARMGVYVGITHPVTGGAMPPQYNLFVSVTVKNVGVAPATNFRGFAKFSTLDFFQTAEIENILSDFRNYKSINTRSIPPGAIEIFQFDLQGTTRNGLPSTITIPISFLYDSGIRKSLEVSRAYSVFKHGTGSSITSFSLAELLSAQPMYTGREGGLACQHSVIGGGVVT